MIDRTMLLSNFIVSSLARYISTAIIALCMFPGCDHRPEAANESLPVAANESSKHGDASAEPLEVEPDIKLTEQTLKTEPTKPRSEEDPVIASLSVSQENLIIGETFELTVVLNVDSGYEIHSLDASPPKIPTLLELEVPPGFTALEEWRSPAPVRSFNPGGGSVYLGETNFVRKIHIATDAKPGDYLLACSVSYQACNSRQCLRPMKTQLSVKLSLSR
jgi:hypothetical protein